MCWNNLATREIRFVNTVILADRLNKVRCGLQMDILSLEDVAM